MKTSPYCVSIYSCPPPTEEGIGHTHCDWQGTTIAP